MSCRFRFVAGAASQLLLVAAFGVPAGSLAQNAFKDPLDQPARQVVRAESRPAMAVARAGNRLVAVGLRGLIIVSADGGNSWTQSKVPVQSDLLAVHFPVPNTGWVVGHDGVVLRSDDAGSSWIKQLDVRSAAPMFRKYYEELAGAGDAAARQALKALEHNFKEGTALPYLDVWFEDRNRGFVVGSYGLLITTTDGGNTWTPWFERVDSQGLNLNSVRGIDGDVMLAGEQGRIYRLDRDKARFATMSTGYAGSFFGLVGNANAMLAFGLRGVVYRCDAKGRDWQLVKTPSEATIVAGSVVPGDSRFLLANAAGQILVGDASGRSFVATQPQTRMRLTGVLPLADSNVAISGLGGVAVETLSPSAR